MVKTMLAISERNFGLVGQFCSWGYSQNAFVGGLVGINYIDVLNCYATGEVAEIGETPKI